jgi:hypothetical protein
MVYDLEDNFLAFISTGYIDTSPDFLEQEGI